VMFELGQPLHAFDQTLINNSPDSAKATTGKQIIVRKAKSGEKILALDDKEYELTNEDLVIADSKKALAIAGVMGGKISAISASTTKIVLESANFEHVTIRKTSQRLGLRSESSARFEKSLDPNLSPLALARAIELILEICPNAKVVTQVTDKKNFKLNQGPIKTSVDYIQKRIGYKVPEKEIVRILTSLGFVVKAAKSGDLSVIIPTWRATKDITGDYDLVEEVARMYGFNNIPAVLPTAKLVRAPFDPLKSLIDQVKPLLAFGFEMAEIYNYSFVAEDYIKKFGESEENYIRVANPQAKGLDLLRRSLVHNLVKSCEANARFSPAFNLFEVGQVFKKEEKGEATDHLAKEFLPKQDVMAAGLIYEKGNKQPFYIAKNVVDILLHRLHFKPQLLTGSTEVSWLNGQRFLEVRIGDQSYGYVSELDPTLAGKLGIKERVAVFEINLSKLSQIYNDRVEYSAIPKYPSIEMDISMIIDKGILWQEVLDQIASVNLTLVRNVEMFDIYSGEGIPEDKKSVAFRITYRSEDKTLETVEAEALHKKIKEILKSKLDATIRE
jgi:phenylalanyl-tRNA synthetase beta chain